MKRGTTLFLKLAVIFISIPVLALTIFGFIWLANNSVNPDYAYIFYPILVGIFVSVFPFLVALYQAFKLLSYIDKNQAFSEFSVKALKNIKLCAWIISGIYLVILPFVYIVAEIDDAPGLILVGMIPIFASMVIAIFAAVLQKLLKEAIDIKSENAFIV
ncbi:DUF2975 domain-containing protein [Saliterribacillus persicus]|uniref:DUF2975 family protein n=1 Tax=Saliterribacillus persicus TaxID=930114 RepID=A0A368XT21_9BACI|nr:DUF2975 domain-containing protein [Saliterribacillus persicus]RCW69667.1 DUF2975 family protein [Saliterribacillus persicus]